MNLVDAVTRGDTSTVDALLLDGVDPDSCNFEGTPALNIAAAEGHLDIAALLLKAGASVNLGQRSGRTPLMVAAYFGFVELARLLLDHDADVNQTTATGTALGYAISGGHEDVVEVLVAAGANVHVDNQVSKVSPILLAANQGHVAIASRLLAAGAAVSDVDMNGNGVIYHAAMQGHTDMIYCLVRNKADPNATSPSGTSPLYVASAKGHIDAIKALLDAGANIRNPAADSCMVAAAMHGHSEIVAFLLQAGADVNWTTSLGITALHSAAYCGHAHIVRQLAYAAAKLDARTFDGNTPVTFSQNKGHAEVLAVLHEVRVKKMEMLHAARHGDVNTVQALLAEGLSVNETDEHANTLLHLALLGRHDDLVSELLKVPLVELDTCNEFGESPVAIATKLGSRSLVRELHAAHAPTATQVAARPTANLQVLGRGSYGIVFKDQLSGQDVALKTVVNSSSEAAKNLQYEIHVLEHTPSPYLVRLLATADAASNAPQLFFEYMDSGNLTSYLEKVAKDEESLVTYTPIEILWVVANALYDLHAKSVVHRDIKPDNILLSSKYYIKVGDVGIAKEATTNMTTGAGTNKWRAPEVLTSGSRYGTPADIYSTQWVTTLAADCTAVDPTRRPTAAKLISILLPKLQSQQHLVASMPVFEKARAAVLQEVEAIVVPPREVSETTTCSKEPPIIASLQTEAPLSKEAQFLQAVRVGDVDTVRAFLASGVHPDSSYESRETALSFAVSRGHLEMVNLLLAYNANVNVAATNGLTPLHEAAPYSTVVMLQKLLGVPNIHLNPRDIKQRTPLHYALHFALDNLPANVTALVCAGADLEAADDELNRPLHYAAMLGNLAMTTLLLQHNARINERNKDGETPLFAAMVREHTKVAALLLSEQANANVLVNGQSVLHCACERGLADIILLLLAKKADVNAKHNGYSPLAAAVVGGHTDVAAILLLLPHIDRNERHESGLTLMHLAVSSGNADVVRILLQAGFDFDERDSTMLLRAVDLATCLQNSAVLEAFQPVEDHRLALMLAVGRHDVTGFATLLQEPYSCNVYDEVGCSLVHMVVLANNEAILDLLLAKPNVRLATPNHQHKTPLAMAIERGYTSMAKKLFHTVHPAVYRISASDYTVTTTELGAGGFGIVYLGLFEGQKVAIKKARSANHMASIKAEVDALLACPSPYLVRLVAIADLNSVAPTLLFEHMDGGSLRSFLDKKRLNQRTSARVTSLQVAWVVANALRDLHIRNMAHRDIKSDNVLLSSSDEIKLGDMGLARIVATEMTEAPGTRLWMAPEILRASGTSYGLSADIYAFGVLLTELATGQLPYFDQNVQDPIAFVRGVIDGTLRPTLPSECELWLRTLADMCLRGDPADRPTADQIVEMLRNEMVAVPTAAIDAPTMFLRAVASDDVDVVAHLLRDGLSHGATLPGDTSLLVAATNAGAIATVRLLLDRGANVNALIGGQMPLHEAATRGNVDILRLFLDAGAHVDAQDHEGKTPLACAVGAASESCIKQLLATGSDVSIPKTNGMTPLKTAQDADEINEVHRFVPLLLLATHRDDANAPEMFCINCGSWHLVEADCSTCGHRASTHDRVVAVLRRLIQLHLRGHSVNWARKCTTCRKETMLIVDTICPDCSESQPRTNEVKTMSARLKVALKTRRATTEERPLPCGILRWLTNSTTSAAPSHEPLRLYLPRQTWTGGNRDTPRTKPSPQRTLGEFLPWLHGDCFGNADLARAAYAAAAEPVFEVPRADLPEPGVPFDLQDRVVTHRYVGDDDNLEAIAACPSPFLVTVVATAPPSSMLVEYVVSKSLRYQLDEPSVRAMWPVDPSVKMLCLYTVANALVDLHAHGIVHGHLSSYDVIWSSTEMYQVDVPGIVGLDEARLAWVAPEVLAGDSPPSLASDMYAFGVVMTEIDTFELPFEDDGLDDRVALTTAVVDGGLRPTLRDECDDWYRTLVDRCLAADPVARPTASDVANFLQAFIHDIVTN
ncbi:TKL/TKL-UNIQUE protein kinase, variant [Saprolegnia diclina VS20]|uniref:TKL/TKL-UNIQUE protein kinase, variant n=1 Tax=Saprolegnia diclina (strain VS20) TaxID=1156394 RepID=T0RP82_SAPDV|nr:TKL/TKL-UNIQUE protein kinase, variant [Saprolegnia diclina VS20]EQC31907.1 TKL/TKL-UNIQUE protein kinase, variant [Saprolegnia diclina VS20]|eukprot:XP_008614634.1 TKL/TKL-UNIQUE protein kinase, variant [Saprolegnia diclina VS20]